jgi:hypothetical protein
VSIAVLRLGSHPALFKAVNHARHRLSLPELRKDASSNWPVMFGSVSVVENEVVRLS